MLLKRRANLILACAMVALLTACSSSHPRSTAVTSGEPASYPAPSSVPRSALGRGIYKVGHPYKVDGSWYYPAENASYDESGIASWYGPNFHEHYTANGEIFDQNTLSAAHRTLPMPSIVEVTNLDNGRLIQVRVNDRGPFVGDRVIDMSRRAAQLLGFERQGTAKVRVRYLVSESLTAQSIARSNGAEGGNIQAPPAVPTGVVVAQALPDETRGVRQRPAAPPEPISNYVQPTLRSPSYTAQSLAPPPQVYASDNAGATPRDSLDEPDHVLVPPHGGLPGPRLPQSVAIVPVGPSAIYIQAGAFAMRGNADRVRSRLAALGRVTVTNVHVNGLSVYRVRIGPIGSVDDADRIRQQAVQAGATEARITVSQ